MERFETVWTWVVGSPAAYRSLWAAQFEIFAQIDRAPEIREFLADAQQQGRVGLASLLHNVDPTVEEEKAQAVGGFYHALLSGILVQWLTDPDRAPSGRDLADALRTIVADVGPVDELDTSNRSMRRVSGVRGISPQEHRVLVAVPASAGWRRSRAARAGDTLCDRASSKIVMSVSPIAMTR